MAAAKAVLRLLTASSLEIRLDTTVEPCGLVWLHSVNVSSLETGHRENTAQAEQYTVPEP